MLRPSAAHIGYIWWLHVEPDSRRRGVGRYLMVQGLDHLRRLSCDTCWLTTGADNWPAQPLYLALGFEVLDCSASYRKRFVKKYIPDRSEIRDWDPTINL